MNAVYAAHVGDRPPARATVEVAKLPSGALVEIEAVAWCRPHNAPVRREIEDYVRELGLDAYLVGGAVRDELLGLESKDADFLVPGVDTEGLKGALEPHGRVEDLIVGTRLVGVRLHPGTGRSRGSPVPGSSSRRRARR